MYASIKERQKRFYDSKELFRIENAEMSAKTHLLAYPCIGVGLSEYREINKTGTILL